MKGVQAVTGCFERSSVHTTMANHGWSRQLTCDGQDEAIVEIWAYWGLTQDRWLR